MARKAFYSFHYEPDSQRASKVRNMGVIAGNQEVSDNTWEEITDGGDPAIEAWIASELAGKSCAIVLIGASTAGRKWINYEIVEAWNSGKGVLGVHIHNLTNLAGLQTSKGANPFSGISLPDGTKLSSVVETHDPPYASSKYVYGYIEENLTDWVESAISIRGQYS